MQSAAHWSMLWKIAKNLPSEQDVINLYNANDIKKMRIYFPDAKVFNALKGTVGNEADPAQLPVNIRDLLVQRMENVYKALSAAGCVIKSRSQLRHIRGS
ncbi:hypothetical protein HAX54_048182 [Datura stramonium]|uniref:Uncharacterized protein n=1 Tax=Datura stramonium TaxID=4076 RepID=A0ABS8STQ0_DATST|nr:hypothetical protein [Datura stramonium]